MRLFLTALADDRRSAGDIPEGADALELGVRCSADGVAVLSSASTTSASPIFAQTAADLAAAGVGGLVQCLAVLGGRIDVHVELLSAEPELVDAVATAVAEADPDRLQVGSAEPAILARLAEALPEVIRYLVLLPAPGASADFVHRAIQLARLGRADAVHLSAEQCSDEALAAFDAHSLDVAVRDLRDADELSRLATRGVRHFRTASAAELRAAAGT